MSEPGQASASAVIANAAVDRSDAPLDGSVQRDSTIWFEDGNVVVIAQNVAFRVHRSVLSLHSQAFRDLFAVPQPSKAEDNSSTAQPGDTFGDCPVVRVTDTSYDFRELLRAIYHGGVSHLDPDATVPFSVLAALARLGHKYQLDQLLEAVVRKLQRTFATKFDVWDRSGGFDAALSPIALNPRDAIEALNPFRRLDRPDMVPVAVYGCCQLQPAELLQGVVRRDGVSPERLAPADLERCLETKPRLMQAAVRLLMALAECVEGRKSEVCGKQGNCSKPKACADALGALLSSTRESLRSGVGTDALNGKFGRDVDARVRVGKMCARCGDALSAAHRGFRKEAWGSLPAQMRLHIAGWDSEKK